MTDHEPRTLGEIGERAIIDGLLTRRYGLSNPQFGDDVAVVLELSDLTVVATTDPAPQPVAWNVSDMDYFDWGWLLATINLSDLGAAGASPLGLLTSITLPNSTKESDFVRLLEGIDACCEAHGTRVLGGNLKESPNATCEGTAVGLIESGRPLSRFTVIVGDTIVGFGEFGGFWAAYLALKYRRSVLTEEKIKQFEQLLRRPTPLVELGIELRQRGLVSSCTDASDGFYGALHSVLHQRGLGASLLADTWEPTPSVAEVATMLNVDPVRLMLGFGDFGLLCGIPQSNLEEARKVALTLGVPTTVFGTVTGSPGMHFRRGTEDGFLNNFDNERFTLGSQFTGGMDLFEERLLRSALVISS